MAVTQDILRSWRSPAKMAERLMQSVQREDRALAYVMVGCFVIFIAQLPRLARLSLEAGGGLDRLAAYEFVGWLIIWPLGLYLIAGLSGLVLRAVGFSIAQHQARLALFWAVLASVPAALLYGLVNGFIGPSIAANITGALWIGGFIIIWGAGLRAGVRKDG
ncbi:MAG: hypothetical protein JKX69_03275 [Rhodobacteraceae bacterium]|nr:hypothetical protein [Paracoccaceae bacterium]